MKFFNDTIYNNIKIKYVGTNPTKDTYGLFVENYKTLLSDSKDEVTKYTMAYTMFRVLQRVNFPNRLSTISTEDQAELLLWWKLTS